MTDLANLSDIAKTLLVDPLNKNNVFSTNLKQQDYGLQAIAQETILYFRMLKLLRWRNDMLKQGHTPENLRSIEASIDWKYGRALPPASDTSPRGLLPEFNAGKEEELKKLLEFLLYDLYHHEARFRSDDQTYNLLKWAGGEIHKLLGHNDPQTEAFVESFAENIASKLAELNAFTDDLDKQNAFFDIDHNFVGMGPLKAAIWKLYQSYVFGEDQGLERASVSMHMAFVGARGKGKTTVVPAVAKALQNLGLIQTANVQFISLNKIADTTLGADDKNLRIAFEAGEHGVVFIDEVDVLADYLAKGHTRSQLSQAINEKMEEMRLNTCVIVAAYPEHIDNFLDSDPGLRSRFGDRVIYFPDYTTADLVKMFELSMARAGYRVEDDNVRSNLWEYLSNLRKNDHKNFADGRTVREFVQSLQAVLQDRLSKAGFAGRYREASATDYHIITVDDIRATIKSINLKKETKKVDFYTEVNPFAPASATTPIPAAPARGTVVALSVNPRKERQGPASP